MSGDAVADQYVSELFHAGSGRLAPVIAQFHTYL